MRSTFIIILLFICVLLSCEYQKDRSVATLNLTPNNSSHRYHYTISNRTTINSEDNAALGSDHRSVMNFVLESGWDSSGKVLKITYNNININFKNHKGEQNISTENSVNSFDPVEKLLGSIKGSTITLRLDKAGNVRHLEGAKEISEKVLAEIVNHDVNTRQSVEGQISKLIGEEFVKNNFQEGLSLLPDTAITVGSSWQRITKQSGDLSFDTETTYNLQDIENNQAHITLVSVIHNPKKSDTALTGTRVTIELMGKQHGYFDIDTITGIVLKGKTSSSIIGKIIAMGREIPIEINIQKEITTKKI